MRIYVYEDLFPFNWYSFHNFHLLLEDVRLILVGNFLSGRMTKEVAVAVAAAQ